ncbi:MAG: L-seryl-tRNA(Sec) selenium transferase, partial [Saprospiraceae bacterium]|nr:L-seryl-tRNA(Sec) selenium transferase [Pyrinomonadaceae bacterium]
TAIAVTAALGRKRVLSFVREATESVRREIKNGRDPQIKGMGLTREFFLEEVERRLGNAWQTERNSSLRRVINATGVVIHTNLGRAPLSENAKRAMLDASGYCTIEYDIETGKRGKRGSYAERLLANITGAESALIVNNCAAATLLVLSVFAKGSEVLVSRGEMVEIGGDFRIPDVLTQSGAILREVGTTNRTRLSDYEKAICERTALILRVHPSNYRITGFTDKPSIGGLAALAHANGMLLFEDAGSGAIMEMDNLGLIDEPVIGRSLSVGADLVSFSGDKLLGGPQAGLIVGRKDAIEKLRKDPLYRALRVDKIICAALEATLEAYARDTALDELPVLQMLSISAEMMEERVRSFRTKLEEVLDSTSEITIESVPGHSAVGGGAAPDVSPTTTIVALTHRRHSDNDFETRLRRSTPPVMARIAGGRVLIDLRTVSGAEEKELIAVLKEIN